MMSELKESGQENVKSNEGLNSPLPDVPWLNLVRFHREIVKQAEDQFFALDGGNSNHSRWTSLRGFNPVDFAGPWEVSASDVESETFKKHQDQGDHETLFLGAAAYKVDIKIKDKWVSRWVPLLYREVDVCEEDGVLKISPQAGAWSFSPLFLNLLSRVEINPAEDLAQQLIEEIHGELRSVSEQILQALFQRHPEIKRDLTQSIPPGWSETPSSWVLFAPTKVFGQFIQHLMADYTSLENALIKDDKKIGGLGVLEVSTPIESKENVDLLPVVPLNSSQRAAAMAVFQEKPVTVISGPPGTGKSQVAVSVLMNAWAQGKTCLFVSNNNKAVNVVNKRLRALQGGTPIVVRAGSSRENTVLPDLSHILMIVAGTNSSSSSSVTREQLVPLERERNELVEFLEARRGKQIDDLRKTTLEAYHEYNVFLENIQNKKSLFDDELITLGGEAGASFPDTEAAFEATKIWADLFIKTCEYLKLDKSLKTSIQGKMNEARCARDRILNGFGLTLDSTDNAEWLVEGIQPAWLFSWRTKLEVLLNGDVDAIFSNEQVNFEFPSMHSSGEIGNARNVLLSLADEINLWCVDIERSLSEIEKAKSDYETSRTILRQYEVDEEAVNCTLFQCEKWIELCDEHSSCRESWIDFFPFSRRNAIDKKLRCLLQTFKRSFPSNVFVNVGDQHYEKLTLLIEATSRWRRQSEHRDAMVARRAGIDAKHRRFVGRARSFEFALQDIPQAINPDAWRRFADRCDEWGRLLAEDERKWLEIEKKQAFKNACRALAEDWQRAVISVPILSQWSARTGATFHGLMTEISVQPSKENIQNAMQAFFDRVFSDLAANWNQAVLQQNQLEKLFVQMNDIPTQANRLSDWVCGKPERAFKLNDGERLTEEALRHWLDRISNWLDRKKEFLETELPTLQTQSLQEHGRALDKLSGARNALPDGEKKRELTGIIDALDPSSDWPTDEIIELLKDFGSDRIHATLSRLEAELERLSLKYAQGLWLSRLHGDQESVQAIAQLKSLYQSSLSIPATGTSVFKKALSVAPIWISTAQSPQSIPLEAGLFDVVMIDEATQCTLTNLLPLIYRGKTLVVLGDEHQLSPIFGVGKYAQENIAHHYHVESYLSTLGHYENNVYTTAVDVLPFNTGDVISLNQHYRSNPLVIGFSNREVYNQSLQLRKDPEWEDTLPVASGMHKVDVRGKATPGPRGKSWKNELEANAVVAKVAELRTHPSLAHKSIGVVTPFRPQKDLILQLLEEGGQEDILVGVVDTFQGDERDIMIFSPVVSRGMERKRGSIRWVEDPHNRINVALTRARDANFIVGDFEICRNLPGILGKLVDYCETIELLRETSPAELYLFSWMMIKGWAPKNYGLEVHKKVGDLEIDFGLRSKNGDRIAVEVDGDIKSSIGEFVPDKARDAALRAKGYEPLHFPARDVFQTPLSVLQKIEDALN